MDPQTELRAALERFDETTSRLRGSYERLQGEVRELRRKLEDKDRELGDSRAERDRLAGYLEHLLESVPTGVVAVDPAGRISTLNRAAQEITGLGPLAVGAVFRDVFPFVEPPPEGTAGLEVLEDPGRGTVEIRRPDGERALLGLRVSPFRGEGGEVLGRVAVFQDVTRLKRLEEQESRNQRLVAMGEMAAGIAHEIRNPLGSLELFASHLVGELQGGPHEDLAGHVLKGIQNVSRITGNLLLFARKTEPRFQTVDLGGLAADALLYARSAAAAKRVQVQEELSACVVQGDPDLLRQVLLNLVLNAIQAVGEGGRIRVACRHADGEKPPLALVSVADDGPGVRPEARERIFDPFYTTRSGGIGLGLALVQRIVSAHGGWVSVGESGWGAGAEFLVGLPQAGAGGPP
ncbi:MAG: PAS domain-containing protein [Deltaproteobacteria bacterium]|nr:PAS domain-containing protein [Deltaproteobacteria bacterium]